MVNRLIEIQPSYSFWIKDQTILERFQEIGTNSTEYSRIVFFNDKDQRNLEFKLLTQKYRSKAIFGEVPKSFDEKDLIDISNSNLERPFLTIETSSESGVKNRDLHLNMKRVEDMLEVTEKFFSEQTSKDPILVIYGDESVHENNDEIIRMDMEMRMRRMLNVTNETVLETLMSHEDYAIGLFYYSDASQFNHSTVVGLSLLPDSILIGYLPIELFKSFISKHVKEEKFIKEVSTNPNYTNGALAVVSPGKIDHKMDSMIVFDEYHNITEVMMHCSIRWSSNEKMKVVEPQSMEKDMLETVLRDKVYMCCVFSPKFGLPFEYMLVAVNPRFRNYIDFHYYMGTEDRVLKAFKTKEENLPALIAVHYTKETYRSAEYFSMHPIEDASKSGFKNYFNLLRIMNDVADVLLDPLYLLYIYRGSKRDFSRN